MSYPWTWCQDRTTQLRKSHKAGLSFSVMAEMFRTTRSAIAGKCARLGLVRVEKDFAAAGRIGGKISAQKRRESKPPKRVSKFNFARPTMAPERANGTAESSSLPVPPLPPLNLALVNLTPTACRYPYGDRAPFQFCGHEQHPGSSYCPAHCQLCERPA